jgi:4-hydroxybenzoate polyprenyltransferase
MARPSHWIKNVLLVPGVVVAIFYRPDRLSVEAGLAVALAAAATCLTASSNYVLNELLDATTDRAHPLKAARPAALGRVDPRVAVGLWLLLGALGIALAASVNLPTAATAGVLWIMGVAYNVGPLRLKGWPYLDVLGESINNALRLALGWFPVIADRIPPLSLVIAYWMAGAYLMAVKRFSEFRYLSGNGDPAAYRASFAYYTEQRLLVSLVFYASLASLFGGVFMLRYRLELLLLSPLLAGLFAHYLTIGFKPRSSAQQPERLYRERRLVGYLTVIFIVFVALMTVRIDVLYDWFGVEPVGMAPLWRISR